MFSLITWGQYFTSVGVILSCYYLIVAHRYYRWEILNLIGIKKVEEGSISFQAAGDFESPFATNNSGDLQPGPFQEIDISPLVQTFTDEVQAYLQELANDRIDKEALLNSIRAISLKYPALKDADCKEDLIQAVLKEANTKYPDLLQLSDLTGLWK